MDIFWSGWEGEEGYPGPLSEPRLETALRGPITTLKGPTPEPDAHE